VNPLPGGKRLRFANAAEDRDAKGWLSLYGGPPSRKPPLFHAPPGAVVISP